MADQRPYGVRLAPVACLGRRSASLLFLAFPECPNESGELDDVGSDGSAKKESRRSTGREASGRSASCSEAKKERQKGADAHQYSVDVRPSNSSMSALFSS